MTMHIKVIHVVALMTFCVFVDIHKRARDYQRRVIRAQHRGYFSSMSSKKGTMHHLLNEYLSYDEICNNGWVDWMLDEQNRPTLSCRLLKLTDNPLAELSLLYLLPVFMLWVLYKKHLSSIESYYPKSINIRNIALTGATYMLNALEVKSKTFVGAKGLKLDRSRSEEWYDSSPTGAGVKYSTVNNTAVTYIPEQSTYKTKVTNNSSSAENFPRKNVKQHHNTNVNHYLLAQEHCESQKPAYSIAHDNSFMEAKYLAEKVGKQLEETGKNFDNSRPKRFSHDQTNIPAKNKQHSRGLRGMDDDKYEDNRYLQSKKMASEQHNTMIHQHQGESITHHPPVKHQPVTISALQQHNKEYSKPSPPHYQSPSSNYFVASGQQNRTAFQNAAERPEKKSHMISSPVPYEKDVKHGKKKPDRYSPVSQSERSLRDSPVSYEDTVDESVKNSPESHKYYGSGSDRYSPLSFESYSSDSSVSFAERDLRNCSPVTYYNGEESPRYSPVQKENKKSMIPLPRRNRSYTIKKVESARCLPGPHQIEKTVLKSPESRDNGECLKYSFKVPAKERGLNYHHAPSEKRTPDKYSPNQTKDDKFTLDKAFARHSSVQHEKKTNPRNCPEKDKRPIGISPGSCNNQGICVEKTRENGGERSADVHGTVKSMRHSTDTYEKEGYTRYSPVLHKTKKSNKYSAVILENESHSKTLPQTPRKERGTVEHFPKSGEKDKPAKSSPVQIEKKKSVQPSLHKKKQSDRHSPVGHEKERSKRGSQEKSTGESHKHKASKKHSPVFKEKKRDAKSKKERSPTRSAQKNRNTNHCIFIDFQSDSSSEIDSKVACSICEDINNHLDMGIDGLNDLCGRAEYKDNDAIENSHGAESLWQTHNGGVSDASEDASQDDEQSLQYYGGKERASPSEDLTYITASESSWVQGSSTNSTGRDVNRPTWISQSTAKTEHLNIANIKKCSPEWKPEPSATVHFISHDREEARAKSPGQSDFETRINDETSMRPPKNFSPCEAKASSDASTTFRNMNNSAFQPFKDTSICKAQNQDFKKQDRYDITMTQFDNAKNVTNIRRVECYSTRLQDAGKFGPEERVPGINMPDKTNHQSQNTSPLSTHSIESEYNRQVEFETTDHSFNSESSPNQERHELEPERNQQNNLPNHHNTIRCNSELMPDDTQIKCENRCKTNLVKQDQQREELSSLNNEVKNTHHLPPQYHAQSDEMSRESFFNEQALVGGNSYNQEPSKDINDDDRICSSSTNSQYQRKSRENQIPPSSEVKFNSTNAAQCHSSYVRNATRTNMSQPSETHQDGLVTGMSSVASSNYNRSPGRRPESGRGLQNVANRDSDGTAAMGETRSSPMQGGKANSVASTLRRQVMENRSKSKETGQVVEGCKSAPLVAVKKICRNYNRGSCCYGKSHVDGKKMSCHICSYCFQYRRKVCDHGLFQCEYVVQSNTGHTDF